jgi:hypothetical protein
MIVVVTDGSIRSVARWGGAAMRIVIRAAVLGLAFSTDAAGARPVGERRRCLVACGQRRNRQGSRDVCDPVLGEDARARSLEEFLISPLASKRNIHIRHR